MASYRSSPVVVLGGTGFIGRHLCEALHSHQADATVISHRPDVRFLKQYAPSLRSAELGTVEAAAALESARVILHLGYLSRPWSNPEAENTEVDENVLPVIRLVSHLGGTNKGVRLIYASSGGQIYGPGHRSPISESSDPRPATPYALGKHLIEQSLLYFSRQEKIRATILRIANPVGRWQLLSMHGFVAAAVAGALSAAPVTLFGPGLNVRDYFDVRDLTALLVRLSLERDVPEGIFNVGSGSGWTERQILALVMKVVGREIEVRELPSRPFDMPYAVLDVTRAREALAWSPRYELSETIEVLAESFRNGEVFTLRRQFP